MSSYSYCFSPSIAFFFGSSLIFNILSLKVLLTLIRISLFLFAGISLDRTPPEKPARKMERNVQIVKSDITITVDKPPTNESNKVPTLPRTYVAPSGVEYTYIPLKGPLPPPSTTSSTTLTRARTREVKSATTSHTKSSSSATKSKGNIAGKPKAKSATPSPIPKKREEEPKYIRIKLKPDYMYDDEESTSTSGSAEVQKPYTLNLNDAAKKPSQSFAEIMRKESDRIEQMNYAKAAEPVSQGKSLSNTPNASPKLSRHTFLKEVGSKTPSPSLSRKSSFCSLFKSRETIISPESPTVHGNKRKNTLTGILREASDSIRERSRSRSKSRERDKSATMSVAPSSTESIDSKSKQKGVFSIFKTKKNEKGKSDVDSTSSPEVLPSLEGLANVEFKFNSDSNSKGHRSRPAKRHNETPLEGESIRIPLHSPTHSESRSTLQDQKTSSQDSQETVIEVTSRNVDAIIEPAPNNIESNTAAKVEKTNRQSSTSSENVVFSTKLGSSNEIFTTKLPKGSKVQKTNSEEEAKKVAKEKCPSCKANQENVAPRLVMEISQMEITNGVAKDIHVTSTQVSVSKVGEVKEVAVEKTEAAITVDKVKEKTNRNSIVEEEHNSSESERDSEFEFLRKKDLTLKLDEAMADVVEPERKGLVLQQDSFEDELPYVPTTLPLERSVAVPIVPVKQRSTFEMKTCPIERPRSTTPINPSCLEEYCEEVIGNVNVENITKTIEKLKIILPRDDPAQRHSKTTSPRKTPSNPNWTAFAEKGISTQRRSSQEETLRPSQEETTPPPLPPKGIQREWINFEEIPERRKPPKRIQTIPSRGNIEVPDSVLQENVVYSYVNPEDCKCECHEISAREREKKLAQEEPPQVQEDELPLLEDEDEKSTASERMRMEMKDRVR